MVGDNSTSLRALANLCRRQARGASTRRPAILLNVMAGEYDRQADGAAAAEASRAESPRSIPRPAPIVTALGN
jgi:hypothetical protein